MSVGKRELDLAFGVADAIVTLENAAVECDEWARQSRVGGWSTHQVDANIRLAHTLRSKVADLKAMMAASTP